MDLWPPIQSAFAWVHRIASLLNNEAQLDGDGVRIHLRGLLGAIGRWKAKAVGLESGIDHLLKVTRSYWPGLFHCYDIEGLPRTNNDLEQVFGQWKHHQRRCTGRKRTPATAVTRGSVQLIAAMANRYHTYSANDLATVAPLQWKQVRAQLEEHRHKRVLQRRFRCAPIPYLQALEQKLVKLILPP